MESLTTQQGIGTSYTLNRITSIDHNRRAFTTQLEIGKTNAEGRLKVVFQRYCSGGGADPRGITFYKGNGEFIFGKVGGKVSTGACYKETFFAIGQSDGTIKVFKKVKKEHASLGIEKGKIKIKKSEKDVSKQVIDLKPSPFAIKQLVLTKKHIVAKTTCTLQVYEWYSTDPNQTTYSANLKRIIVGGTPLGNCDFNESCKKIATFTPLNHVRIYDIYDQKKDTFFLNLGVQEVTSVKIIDAFTTIVGTTTGALQVDGKGDRIWSLCGDTIYSMDYRSNILLLGMSNRFEVYVNRQNCFVRVIEQKKKEINKQQNEKELCDRLFNRTTKWKAEIIRCAPGENYIGVVWKQEENVSQTVFYSIIENKEPTEEKKEPTQQIPI